MKSLVFCAIIIASIFGTSIPSGTGAQAQVRKPKGRALLVGINRYQHPGVNPVKGAEEDVQATEEFIREQYGFTTQEIHKLTGAQATRAAILREFAGWLIAETRPGDRVFFLFSGHGSQVRDLSGDEKEDHYDETLVPYDADVTGKNQILDDELEALIAQLSGRLSVLVFDSCHSGTVTRTVGGNLISGRKKGTADGQGGNAIQPRYLPNPEEFARLKTQSRAVGGGKTGYEIQPVADDKLPVTRDLRLVKEDVSNATAGLIVISAARPNQVAFPMLVESGEYRGALSYAFCEVQRQNPRMALQQLQQAIAGQIAVWQQSGRLKGQQTPIFEISSPEALLNQPIFPVATEQLAVPAIALANPASTMKVTLRNLEGKTQFQLKDEISYEVTTNKAGWLYLLALSERNEATCVFPNKESQDDADNYIRAGKHRLPHKGFYEAQEPLGKDIVIALLSSIELKLGDKEKMTWDEVFDRLQSNQLRGYVKTRGIGTKKSSTTKPQTTTTLAGADWQAASLVTETILKSARRSAPANETNSEAGNVSSNPNNPKQR